MKNLLLVTVLCGLMMGCSTRGGIYSGGGEHGEFSPGRTFLTILGIAAVAAAARHGGGGAGGFGTQYGYAWDYQPGDGTWVCRDRSDGQYAFDRHCEGVPLVDAWP